MPDEGGRRLPGAADDPVRAGERVVLASILRDKDAGAMLTALSRAGGTFVATRSSSERALPAAELGRLARAHFREVHVEENPAAALRLARSLGPVLATGSLYLLGDLARADDAGSGG